MQIYVCYSVERPGTISTNIVIERAFNNGRKASQYCDDMAAKCPSHSWYYQPVEIDDVVNEEVKA